MYHAALVLHSFLRWFVVIFGVAAVFGAARGWTGGRAWGRGDRTLGLLFVTALDLQVTIGLLLYFVLSPFGQMLMENPGAAMANRLARFWTVEHVALMVAALALTHVGQVKARHGATSEVRHRAVVLYFTLAMLLILAGLPWPFLSYGRPWLRLN